MWDGYVDFQEKELIGPNITIVQSYMDPLMKPIGSAARRLSSSKHNALVEILVPFVYVDCFNM